MTDTGSVVVWGGGGGGGDSTGPIPFIVHNAGDGSLYFILEAKTYWRWERPGNEAMSEDYHCTRLVGRITT